MASHHHHEDTLKQYGLTPTSYSRLLDYQLGGCAICGREPTKRRRLAVDHNHRSGKVRGLLCTRCNVGLGLFDESIERLLEAVSYLRYRN